VEAVLDEAIETQLRPRIVQKGLRPFVLNEVLYFPLFMYLWNAGNESIDGQVELIAGDYRKALNLKVAKKRGKRELLTSFHLIKIPLNKLGDGINTSIICRKQVGPNLVTRRLSYKQKRLKTRTKLYYRPFSVRHYRSQDRCLHLRRTGKGSLVIVRRKMEPIEKTLRFRFIESWPVSLFLFCLGRMQRTFSRNKVILFYEKFSSKAEEGAYELFCMARAQAGVTAYYIIDEDSDDYPRIQGENVVGKYSSKYYRAIYCANTFIGTEIPTHLSILRSNNRYLRHCFYSGEFVFLQHGIIYMKNLGTTSSFVRGREGAADHIVVSSKKEQQIVMRDLLYDEDQTMLTGLGQFDTIEYGKINSESRDIVTVMLTWKPYDENQSDILQTTYCQSLQQVLNVVLRFISKEQLRVVAHPKVVDSLAHSSLHQILWKGSIKEALTQTKLLITDYSSVCYNVFYQGGAVLFYQPFLQQYEAEMGPLIPSDDEFIGSRAFSEQELAEQLAKGIDISGHIILHTMRLTHYEQIYASINEFCDGNNLQRIFQALIDRDVLVAQSRRKR
jgi:hypothetical protein